MGVLNWGKKIMGNMAQARREAAVAYKDSRAAYNLSVQDEKLESEITADSAIIDSSSRRESGIVATLNRLYTQKKIKLQAVNAIKSGQKSFSTAKIRLMGQITRIGARVRQITQQAGAKGAYAMADFAGNARQSVLSKSVGVQIHKTNADELQNIRRTIVSLIRQQQKELVIMEKEVSLQLNELRQDRGAMKGLLDIDEQIEAEIKAYQELIKKEIDVALDIAAKEEKEATDEELELKDAKAALQLEIDILQEERPDLLAGKR